jgi:hypothetical protein
MWFSEGKSLVHTSIMISWPFSIAQYGTILHGQKQDTWWTPENHLADRLHSLKTAAAGNFLTDRVKARHV